MADAATAVVAIAAAAAAASASVDAQPPPAPRPRHADLVVAKALVLLSLASLSVGFAAAGAVAVAFAACNDGDRPCPVLHVLAATCIRALVVAGMLASVAPVLVVRAAMCDAGLRDDLTISIVRHMQVCPLR